MNKPHKWAKEIKAWADGAEIECRFLYAQVEQKWQVTNAPRFEDPQWEYRIKPQPKEPQYLYVYFNHLTGVCGFCTEWGDDAAFPLLGKIKLEEED